jgi:S-adenosylhomocysteine hydrolase
MNTIELYEKLCEYKEFITELDQMPIFKELIPTLIKTRPFEGNKIAIAHVLVPNCLPLIFSITAGGGDITVTPYSNNFKVKPKVQEILNFLDIKLDLTLEDVSEFDFALDCAGKFIKNTPKFGIVELTRSGILKYLENSAGVPIVNVDDSITKIIETFFGNGEALYQAIKSFIGQPENILQNEKVAILGFGKIGRGSARKLKTLCDVIICDVDEEALKLAKKLGFKIVKISSNPQENSKAIGKVKLFITATGINHVVSSFFDKNLLKSDYLINLGAEDEFGPNYNEAEVFMSKYFPFNFNLEPPTPSKFIDPILASQVYALKYLISNSMSIGIHPLSKKIDQYLVSKFSELNQFDISDLKLYFFEYKDEISNLIK